MNVTGCMHAKDTTITRFLDAGVPDVSPSMKWIRFADVGVGEGTLDQYLLGRPPQAAGSSRVGKFRPIGTSDNEVCLFPVSATMRLCAVVAYLFSKSILTHAFDSTPLLKPYLLNRNDRKGPDDTSGPAAPIMERRRSIYRGETTPTQQRTVGNQEEQLLSEWNMLSASNYAEPSRPASFAARQRLNPGSNYIKRQR